MEIVLDAGNTFIKSFVFTNNVITETQQFSYTDIRKLIAYCNSLNATIILSDVSGKMHAFRTESTNKIQTYNHLSNLPLTIDYTTPNTLGFDRIAAGIGANSIKGDTDKLIIDLGTAITIDLIDKKNVFRGGNISPGLHTRFKSLHDYTGNLPLVTANNNVDLYGKSTEEAIRNGVINGVIFEIERYIEKYEAIFPDISVFLCGGDAIFFEKMLKKTIFAQPNLLAIGLHTIFKYNVEKNT